MYVSGDVCSCDEGEGYKLKFPYQEKRFFVCVKNGL